MQLFEPPVAEAAVPYWDATREQHLVLPWCTGCERPHWYPRERCPWCLTDTVEWRPASGAGEVYALSVQHRPGPMRDPAAGPYAVVLVELAEGVRVMSNLVDTDLTDATVGMAVQVRWEPLSDGRHLPFFAPA